MNAAETESAILISVDTGEFDAEASLDELRSLASTAGAEVLAEVIQRREHPDPALFLGKGKTAELKMLCSGGECTLIIADASLTPSQARNIEAITGVRTIDRTVLILDIFAMRARSNEGKLQVELAQLQYLLPRLHGKGTELSRLGGGIGTRGPGETKLETDRRHIERRIKALKEQLAAIEKRRGLLRARREKTGVTVVCIAGYTNSGKSTLLNALTDAGVLAENKLFATLDPTSRALRLPDGREVMLIDTVGFISRLPHELVDAFKSTLEDVVSADLILSVCDASDPEYAQKLDVTERLLSDIGAGAIPRITVLNKCDAVSGFWAVPSDRDTVRISALKKIGLEDLLSKTAAMLPGKRVRVRLLIPYDKGSVSGLVRRECAVLSESYEENGLSLTVVADTVFLDRIKEYIIQGENT
ncbi:MAG: GTPase HflX [Clostridiales bacterium]|nr:GTPase HflX [Clostridiales bacterium]